MGLDMYLNRYPRYEDATPSDVSKIESYLGWKGTKNEGKYSLEDWCGVDENDIHMDMVDFYKQYFEHRYSSWDTEKRYGYPRIMESVGYWRKANQIHNWFVENVQNGEDDCGYYNVSKYQLQELLDVCKEVVSKAVLKKSGEVVNGYTFEDGKMVPNYEEGEVIENAEEIAKLLPSASGFFFGSTDYDSYYLRDVKETIEILEKVLAETDFTKEAICYGSSW